MQSTIHPYFDGAPSVMAMSHAGDSDTGHHNGSLKAYELAHDHAFRFFHVDVVAIGGSELASAHAIFGRRRSWEKCSIEEVSAEVGRQVSTLSSLVNALPDGRWNIEVKSRRAEYALIQLLEQPGVIDRVCVSSPFHRGMSRRLRQRFGNAVCLAAPLLDGGLLGLPIWPFRRVRHDAVQVWWPTVWSGTLVKRVVATGTRFQVWTINSPKRIDRMLALGVTGIITDRHQLLRDRLTIKGVWVS